MYLTHASSSFDKRNGIREILLFHALRFIVLVFCITRGNLAICPILNNK